MEEELIGEREKGGGWKVEEGRESARENRSCLGNRNGARKEGGGADFQELERVRERNERNT